MNLTNKQKKIIITTAILLLVLILLIILWLINANQKDMDITNAIHGVVLEKDADFLYQKNKTVKLTKGEHVYILQDDILNNQYLVKYNDKIGKINKEFVKYYQWNQQEKYSIMCDVSEFNTDNDFQSAKEFEVFLLNSSINYVYIRLGGRGWGNEGKLYYDDKAQLFIEACEYLKVPYGFYYLDEALNEEEISEEVKWVKEFIDKNKTEMNVLPLAIDLEYQGGQGRADDIWEERIPILTKLLEEFKKQRIECIVYVNGMRGQEYLEDLECNFWVARYPENDIIPESFYSTEVKYQQMKKILNQLIDSNGKLKSTIDTNEEYNIFYRDEFLEKIVGWQFSETGAVKDNISINIDLSIVKNSFFKNFVDKTKE